MPERRLYTDQPLSANCRLGLGEDPARHAGRVLRLRAGDDIVLFDGSGAEFPARIVAIGRDHLEVETGEARRPAVESPLYTRLIQGVSRGDRMDTVVQKATELGVSRLSPVLTERSVVRLDERRAGKRHRHWLAVAASACEQCGRSVLPQIDAPRALAEVLAEAAIPERARLLLAPGAGDALDGPSPAGGVECLVGPEGGFSDAERAAAVDAGYRPVGLGPRILRTETAAIAVLALAQARWGDLG